MFDPKIYKNRRKILTDQFKSGVLLFLGNQDSPINYPNNYYPFRQDSTFLYYWGLNEPGLVALIDIEEGKETIFGYEYTVDDIVWMGPQKTLAEKSHGAGVSLTGSLADFEARVKKALQQGRDVLYLPQYRQGNQIRLHKLFDQPIEKINSQSSRNFIEGVVAQRSVKGAEEIEEIERALEITYELHTLAMKKIKPGIYEREIVGELQGKAFQMGGSLSFQIIFSIHGETLHNLLYNNLMKTGDMVVNDCGGESALNYAGDITRTIPVSGKFSSKQREIYEIVLAAQIKAIESIGPGKKYLDIHLSTAREMTQGLIDLGIMRGNTLDAVQSGAHALFFPHGLGHMMGLDVHDMENLGENYVGYDQTVQRSQQFGLAYLRMAKALQPGFVLTVEPGIYFIPELIDLWKKEKKWKQFINFDKVDRYRNFGGIRIEDDVLVTQEESKILGRLIPKTAEEVEGVMGSKK
jgi:Xaa-Pro aminopeptidase